MKVRQRLWSISGGAFLLLCVGFVLATYRFGWSSTGFLNKSLWDWLQLLIVPLALAVIALVFQLANSRTEHQIAKQRYEQDQQIALDKQREDLLQAYLDCLAELMLEKQLRSSALDAEVRIFARVRTITILFQLDARRIGYIFAFLREAGLMSNLNDSIVNFSGARLAEINLSGAYIREADFRKTNLHDADLSGAILYQANLSGAILNHANLSKARIAGADLQGADLRDTNLSNANLNATKLSGANVDGADLSGASLHHADLSGVDLSRTDLRGADLSESNLTGAKITSEQLASTKSLKGATMPVGTKHP